MDALTQAMKRVRHTIPPTILRDTFLVGDALDVETEILDKVYKDRVVYDLGLHGYTINNISAAKADILYQDQAQTVVQYKLKDLDHRQIVAVYGLYDLQSLTSLTTANNFSVKPEITAGIMPMANTHCRVQGKNTILINNDSFINLNPSMYFRVDLIETNDLNTKSPKSIILFSEIMEQAVKAYIYNVSDIKGRIQSQFGGTELTPFQNRISDYSGAEEKYQELLANKWGKVTLMEDGQTHEKLMRLQLTGVLDRSEAHE